MSNTLKTIPLCQLRRSKANMRKTDRLADIEPLAASIEANGLLENLVVHAAGTDDAPVFEVVAGGRRLAALKLLVKRKKLDREHSVPCLVLQDPANALEISLTENFERVPTHPADQFEAFATLRLKGRSPDDIASRFGVTTLFVEQRLKLAAVSPRLVGEYRKGAMTLEQLTAFTLSSDHAAQESVWFESHYAGMSAAVIRQQLTRSQVDSSDPRARFIGTKAYEEAGGTILRDLFDAEDEGYLNDSQLLDRLVAEKLKHQAIDVRAEGWQWVEVHTDRQAAQLYRYGRAEPVEVALTEAEQLQLSALAERYDELVATIEEEDGVPSEELDRITAEMAVLEGKQSSWPGDVKARAGAIVCLESGGAPAIYRGLLKEGAELPPAENDEPEPEKPKRQANGYSESLLLDLSAHRTAALREVVAGKPDVAFLALLHALVEDLFLHGSSGSCLRITASEVALERASQTVSSSRASHAFEVRHTAWSERIEQQEELWSYLGQLSETERSELLAHCVAATIDALDMPKTDRRSARAQQLAETSDLDMKLWWQPTRESLFNHMTKSQILTAVSEAAPEISQRLASLKKDKMAEEAERLLAPKGWMPESLRPRPACPSPTT